MTVTLQNRSTTLNAQTDSSFSSLGQQLRQLGSQANRALVSRFNRSPLATATFTGLAAGILTGSSSVFRRQTVAPDRLQLLVEELSRIVPLAFQCCQQNASLNFSKALSQEIQNSSQKELLQLYFQNAQGRSLLSLCDRACAESWTDAQLNEAFVRSQYQGVDRANIVQTLECGISYLFGNHSTDNVSTLRNSYRRFMGSEEDSGANFARIILSAYSGREISSSLRSYLEREGVLSGIAQTASFSGIASSWSGRLLSTLLIGMISRSQSSAILKIGSALLCGAASSLGQVGFQAYWATRNMRTADRINYIQNMEWDFKSALVTGMFCGASELLGSHLLENSKNPLPQILRTFFNFAFFNVSAELVSDSLMNRLGIAAAYVQPNQEDVLGPQSLIGQWVEGAGQEVIGDHTAQVPGQIGHLAVTGMALTFRFGFSPSNIETFDPFQEPVNDDRLEWEHEPANDNAHVYENENRALPMAAGAEFLSLYGEPIDSQSANLENVFRSALTPNQINQLKNIVHLVRSTSNETTLRNSIKRMSSILGGQRPNSRGLLSSLIAALRKIKNENSDPELQNEISKLLKVLKNNATFIEEEIDQLLSTAIITVRKKINSNNNTDYRAHLIEQLNAIKKIIKEVRLKPLNLIKVRNIYLACLNNCENDLEVLELAAAIYEVSLGHIKNGERNLWSHALYFLTAYHPNSHLGEKISPIVSYFLDRLSQVKWADFSEHRLLKNEIERIANSSLEQSNKAKYISELIEGRKKRPSAPGFVLPIIVGLSTFLNANLSEAASTAQHLLHSASSVFVPALAALATVFGMAYIKAEKTKNKKRIEFEAEEEFQVYRDPSGLFEMILYRDGKLYIYDSGAASNLLKFNEALVEFESLSAEEKMKLSERLWLLNEKGEWNFLASDTQFYLESGTVFSVGQKAYRFTEEEGLYSLEELESEQSVLAFPELIKNQNQLEADMVRIGREIQLPEIPDALIEKQLQAAKQLQTHLDSDCVAFSLRSNENQRRDLSNQDGFDVINLPDGRKILLVLDGVGGAEDSEKATVHIKLLIRWALLSGASIDEALDLAHRYQWRENLNCNPVLEFPGAAITLCEIKSIKNGKKRVRSLTVGDTELDVLNTKNSSKTLTNLVPLPTEEDYPAIQSQDGYVEDLDQIRLHRFHPNSRLMEGFVGSYAPVRERIFEMEEGEYLQVSSDGVGEITEHADALAKIRAVEAKDSNLKEIGEQLFYEVLLREALAEIMDQSWRDTYLVIDEALLEKAHQKVLARYPDCKVKDFSFYELASIDPFLICNEKNIFICRQSKYAELSFLYDQNVKLSSDEFAEILKEGKPINIKVSDDRTFVLYANRPKENVRLKFEIDHKKLKEAFLNTRHQYDFLKEWKEFFKVIDESTAFDSDMLKIFEEGSEEVRRRNVFMMLHYWASLTHANLISYPECEAKQNLATEKIKSWIEMQLNLLGLDVEVEKYSLEDVIYGSDIFSWRSAAHESLYKGENATNFLAKVLLDNADTLKSQNFIFEFYRYLVMRRCFVELMGEDDLVVKVDEVLNMLEQRSDEKSKIQLQLFRHNVQLEEATKQKWHELENEKNKLAGQVSLDMELVARDSPLAEREALLALLRAIREADSLEELEVISRRYQIKFKQLLSSHLARQEVEPAKTSAPDQLSIIQSWTNKISEINQLLVKAIQSPNPYLNEEVLKFLNDFFDYFISCILKTGSVGYGLQFLDHLKADLERMVEDGTPNSYLNVYHLAMQWKQFKQEDSEEKFENFLNRISEDWVLKENHRDNRVFPDTETNPLQAINATPHYNLFGLTVGGNITEAEKKLKRELLHTLGWSEEKLKSTVNLLEVFLDSLPLLSELAQKIKNCLSLSLTAKTKIERNFFRRLLVDMLLEISWNDLSNPSSLLAWRIEGVLSPIVATSSFESIELELFEPHLGFSFRTFGGHETGQANLRSDIACVEDRNKRLVLKSVSIKARIFFSQMDLAKKGVLFDAEKLKLSLLQETCWQWTDEQGWRRINEGDEVLLSDAQVFAFGSLPWQWSPEKDAFYIKRLPELEYSMPSLVYFEGQRVQLQFRRKGRVVQIPKDFELYVDFERNPDSLIQISGDEKDYFVFFDLDRVSSRKSRQLLLRAQFLIKWALALEMNLDEALDLAHRYLLEQNINDRSITEILCFPIRAIEVQKGATHDEAIYLQVGSWEAPGNSLGLGSLYTVRRKKFKALNGFFSLERWREYLHL